MSKNTNTTSYGEGSLCVGLWKSQYDIFPRLFNKGLILRIIMQIRCLLTKIPSVTHYLDIRLYCYI